MLSPTIAMMMARARETEVRGQATRSLVIGGDEHIHRQRLDRRVAASSSARRLLISKTGELITLADNLDCRRDELVRMIQSLP
jgi:hypothetical protein